MNYIRGVQYKIRLPKFAIWKGRKNGLDTGSEEYICQVVKKNQSY